MAADAVLFDFDGVIVESEHIKTEAFRRLYAPYGPAVVAAAVAHHRAHGGISRRKKIRHCHRTLLATELSPDELDELCHRFSSLVEDQVVASPMVPGAEALLQALHGRLPLFIVSGTPQEELLRIVVRRDLSCYFDGIFGSPTEKPELIRDILARHGLSADRCLFIGDAMTDYEAARVCGMPFVGRVAAADRDPFPLGTKVIPDLTGFVP